MGNAPSHEGPRKGPRGSYKLSKPKTGNSAAAGLLSPSGPSTNPQRYADPHLLSPLSQPSSPAPSPALLPGPGAADAPMQPALDRRASLPAPTPTRERRRSLFRSMSSHGDVQKRNPRRNTVIGVSNPATAETNTARANSITYESGHNVGYSLPPADQCPPAGSRSSWAYDLNSYEAKRLLNVIDEPTAYGLPTAASSDIQTSPASEAAWTNPYPTQPESVSISRANSDVSLYTPVRRRSVIRTPGVATRTATAPVAGSSYRHSQPPTPNMSRRGSFDSSNIRVLSMPPSPPVDVESMPRVVTPSDGEYTTIGAFKLGSLRIMNGSPVPSAELSRDRESEESSSPGPRASKTDEAVSGTRGGKPSAVGDTRGKAQGRSPLPRIEIPPGSALGLSPGATSFAHDEGGVVSKESTATATAGHDEFLVELEFSPLVLDTTSPALSELQTTSKHTAIEDQLFEADDDKQPEYSAVEVLDVRPDPNAKPPAARPAVRPTQRTGSVDSGVVSSPISESSRSQTLAKTDSGYSSSVSLRSFRLNTKPTFASKEGRAPASERIPTKTQGDSGDLPDQKLTPTAAAPTSEAATRPPKDQPPASPARVSPPVAGGGDPAVRCGSPRIGLLATPSAAGKPVRVASQSSHSDAAPHSPATIPQSPRSAVSDISTSTLSIGSGGSHRQGKLHRLLSLNGSSMAKAKTPLTVHITHAIDKAVPSVPRAVEAKLNEHTGLFPITTKRLALKTQLSKDTLKTIFSVGSVEVSKDESQPPLPPGPDLEGVDEPRESHLRQAWQSMPSTIAHAAALMMPSRKPLARKPVPSRYWSAWEEPAQPESLVAAEDALATHTSVSDSLGSNVYDAVMSSITDHSGAPYTIQAPPARAMTMPSGLESGRAMRAYNAYSPSMPPIQAMDTAEEPSARKDRAPPISLNNRKPTSMRVPPPRRPRSTPPQALYTRASRESLRDQRVPDQVIQRPPHGDDSPPPIPPQNPRRSLELRRSQLGSPVQHRTPNWDVQTDHDAVPSRRPSTEQSRVDPLLEYAVPIPRPASVQPYTHAGSYASLKHRSSYDGLSHVHIPVSYPSYPTPPPPDRTPELQHYDPWSDPPLSAGAQPHGQHGRPPPHASRGHQRNSSSVDSSHVGANGHPPYRVLHSYNSPAYRNAPIWG